MTFEKGKSGNLAGKPKGTKNKMTREIKHVISKLMECSTDEDIKTIYDELKKDKPELILRFWGQLAPKKVDVTADVTFVDKLSKRLEEEESKEGKSE